MRIVEMRTLMGPNIYSRMPVHRVTLDLEDFSDLTTDRVPGFCDRLLESLPGIAGHYCSLGCPGGFVTRMRRGTYFGHVVEHVALELQTTAGEDVTYGTTRGTETPGVYQVVFSCRHPAVAEEAARLAVQLVESLIVGQSPSAERTIQALSVRALQCRPGPSTRAILTAAEERDIPITTLDEGLLFQLGYGVAARRIQAAETSWTSNISADIAKDKILTKRLLAAAGMPVPDGELVTTIDEACQAADRLGYPVVVKPVDGCKGQGVSLCLTAPGEVREAFELTRRLSKRVLVERQVPGRDYRAVVIGGRVEAIAERRPPEVNGDGIHSIRELMEALNADPERGNDHEKPLTRVTVDDGLTRTLAKQGLDLDTVLEPDRKAVLRWHANLSTGGASCDVTAEVHPAIQSLCVRAARVVGLDVAGVDLIAGDITRADGGGLAIIEVNAAPGLRMHLHPAKGLPRAVGEAVIDYLFAEGNGRIPLIAVTGTNGKTTTARLIASAFEEAGFVTGTCTTDSVVIGGEPVQIGDWAGPAGARMILGDPIVEAAVIEVARGGLIAKGLGYDRALVGVITNISEDHLGQDGVHTLDDLAHVKSVVSEQVLPDGWSVLNADDPVVASLACRAGGQIAYFSISPTNMLVRLSLGAGGLCGFVDQCVLVVQRGDRVLLRLPLVKIPSTLGGKAIHNVENALAASVASAAAGLPPSAIEASLVRFSCDLSQNPGRLNLFDYGNIKVLVDYGHNPAGIARIIQAVEAIEHRELIGVVAAPGDRSDETIRRIGRVAGSGFDRLVIREDSDRRGRAPGEVARLIGDGASSVRTRNGVEIVPDEAEAVQKAVADAPDGALVVVFYEKLDNVLSALAEVLGPRPDASVPWQNSPMIESQTGNCAEQN